eukprot:COSAG06_NODE_84_length_25090_cov_20.561042_22_plen_276_part_00
MMRFTQVGSANKEVARLAQKLLLKLECTVMEAAARDATAATASPGGAPLQGEHSAGQSQLIQRVKVGLAQALSDAEAGAVSAYVSVLQLFVDKYRGNAMRRAHASSVRGAPIELRVDFTPLSNVHSNTTAAAVYAQVAALRAAEPPDVDEMDTEIADGEEGAAAAAATQAQPAFLLKNPKGGQQLPRGSMQTMAELGVQSGCVIMEKTKTGFWSTFCIQMVSFTKTCSGQTSGKLLTKTPSSVFSQLRHGCARAAGRRGGGGGRRTKGLPGKNVF